MSYLIEILYDKGLNYFLLPSRTKGKNKKRINGKGSNRMRK